MTIDQAKHNLIKNGWPEVHVWEGGICSRIYVKSIKGYDCGFIQFPENGGIYYDNLTSHEDLIRRAAENR